MCDHKSETHKPSYISNVSIFGSGLIDKVKLSYFKSIGADSNMNTSNLNKPRLRSSGDPILLPFALLDFLLMGVGFLFLGVYSLSLPVLQRV